MLDPVNLRASAAMGSGGGTRRPLGSAGNINEFQTLQGTDQTGAIARFPHYTLIYERLVRTTAAEAVVTTNPGGNIRTTGIANTTYLNLGFDVNPVKELGISVDGYWLRATKVGLWEKLLEDAGGSGGVSKNAGWELDAKLNYKIAKNLTYFVEGGVFWPGKFYSEAPLQFDSSGYCSPSRQKDCWYGSSRVTTRILIQTHKVVKKGSPLAALFICLSEPAFAKLNLIF